MRRWTERRILFWFGPVLLLLLINSLIAYRSIRVLNTNSEREIQTMAVLLQLEGIASTVKDAETGQRGYLLTGDDSYLAPYNEARGQLDLQLSSLGGLLFDDSAQVQRLNQLQTQVQTKRDELQTTVDLRRMQGFDAAIAVVRTNSGKESMDAIRNTIAQMEQTEQEALANRAAETQRNVQATLGTLAFATSLSIALLLGVGFVAYRDVAARRRAAEELHRQREWFEVTLASVGDAVIATDVSSSVTFINSVAEELTGWRREEAWGKPAHDIFNIVNEQTRARVESPVSEVLSRNVIVGLANHTILIAKDGTERAIDDSGAPIRDSRGAVVGVVLVFRDVTTRRRVELDQERIVQFNDALGASLDTSTLLESLVQQFVPELSDICLVDLMQDDGAVRRTYLVDSPASQHTARLQSLLVDNKVAHESYQALRKCSSDRPLLMDRVDDEALACVVGKAGHVALLRSIGVTSVIVVPLHARNQQLGLLTLLATHPRRAYTQDDLRLIEELGRRAALALDNGLLYAQAQAAIRDREQFLSIAAHELRTPLTSLLGRAELMQRRVRLEHVVGERDLRSIQVVVDQSKRLNTMIATLLDLSRIQTGQFVMQRVPLDLCALLRRMIEEFQSALERHTLVYTEAIHSIVVLGDEIRLEQAFVNLLQNAVKYSPDGGVVRVDVTTQDNTVQVSISDEGIGIPAEALPNLFSRFYRASNTVSGSISGMGIGLFVVKEIIDRHEGTVSVRSFQNEGSTFTISLPIASPH